MSGNVKQITGSNGSPNWIASSPSSNIKTKIKSKKLCICPKFVLLYITHLVCQIGRARRQLLRRIHLSLSQMPPFSDL